jgi:hypothetical protein
MQQSTSAHNNKVKILDTQNFLNQLKLLNLSDEFKNTCHFLIQSNLQNGPMLENFTLGIAVMLNSMEGDKSIDVTDKLINELEEANLSVSISEIENGFNLKLVPNQKIEPVPSIIT